MSGWLANSRNIESLPLPAPAHIDRGTGRLRKLQREDLHVDSQLLSFRALAVLALLFALAPAGVRAAGQQGLGAPRTPPPASAEVVPPPEGMSFSTHLDHTAVWVGDQFHYTIIVDHTPMYEFVLDTLTKETVNMDPFQVVDVVKETVTQKSGDQRLYLDVVLTTFATGQEMEQIPQLTLFYFKREAGVLRADEAAAESLTVPGPVIALRSTLPPDANDIRDPVTVSTWPQSRWILAGAGTFSLILLITGLGWETLVFVRRRKSQRGPDHRKAMNEVRERWLSSVPGDFSNAEAAVRFYDQSYQDLKEYVGHYLETATAGLTADEVDQEMQRLNADRDMRARVVKVLGSLETNRYSKNGAAPSPDDARSTAQEIREIFAARR